MSPDDPIYDPVRAIAEATRGIMLNLERLTTTTQETRDLITASLRVERALGWGMMVAVSVLLVVLVVLVVHVL